MKMVLNSIQFRYKTPGTFMLSVDNTQYDFSKNLGIYGLSGSGKTTLGKIIAGLLPSTGLHFSKTSPYIVYSAQKSENIFLGNTLGKSIESIISNNEELGYLPQNIRRYLTGFHMDFDRIKNMAGHQLSSGELRKFALSLALSCEADLLILDEPTIGLDLKSRLKMEEMISQYTPEIVIISHDFELLKNSCDHLWIMQSGQLKFQGSFDGLQENSPLYQELGLDFLDKIKKKRKPYLTKLKK